MNLLASVLMDPDISVPYSFYMCGLFLLSRISQWCVKEILIFQSLIPELFRKILFYHPS